MTTHSRRRRPSAPRRSRARPGIGHAGPIRADRCDGPACPARVGLCCSPADDRLCARTHSPRDHSPPRRVHRRPVQSQARRRCRPAQSLAAPSTGARTWRGCLSQEHPADRPHRRRQDRDRTPPGNPGARSVRQGRGNQVQRNWLPRPRRRVDGARHGRLRDCIGSHGKDQGSREARQRGSRTTNLRCAARRARPRGIPRRQRRHARHHGRRLLAAATEAARPQGGARRASR